MWNMGLNMLGGHQELGLAGPYLRVTALPGGGAALAEVSR